MSQKQTSRRQSEQCGGDVASRDTILTHLAQIGKENKKEYNIHFLFFDLGTYTFQDWWERLPNNSSTCKASVSSEVLEATVLTAGNKPVDYSDAAAIQAAEVRATGRTTIVPGGVAAAAQSAATRNARATRDEDKTKLAEILAEASTKLLADKPVTRRDAEGVIELGNDPNLCTRPGGVAASLAAAARLNQSLNQNNQPS
ncbi:hypothetical protein ACH5RR_023132 [Cinchona calisaya]|uniref:SMP domain-containing protein n=1 Tax=Cinchona calisaya TaxID=153742 RepID=A0ABD2Z9S6_9GENT